MSLENFFKTNMSIEQNKRVQLDGKLWEITISIFGTSQLNLLFWFFL